ncbi:MAG: aminotransferase class III-fold pyridoxal phosphate-dependent enzyme, partial [Burkholderiaceae bacterium]
MDIAHLTQLNGRHMLHPMVDPKATQQSSPLILEKADGVYVWDVNCTRYLDTVASLWNVNVGHNHP